MVHGTGVRHGCHRCLDFLPDGCCKLGGWQMVASNKVLVGGSVWKTYDPGLTR